MDRTPIQPNGHVPTAEKTSLFRSEKERAVALSAKEQEGVLHANPSFRSIERSTYFDNYDLPCPIRVDVRTDHGEASVVLRKTRHGDVRKEVAMLRALKEFGLPVPEVLYGPFQNEEGEQVAVYTLLAGENLQILSASSPGNLNTAIELLIEAVRGLAGATDAIAATDIGKNLEARTLSAELEEIKSDPNPWLSEPFYQVAIAHIASVLPTIATPLVLSNGDYQPGNFLAQDGRLTGFLDFESASLQDPLMGFAKYPIYDLRPLSRTGLVEQFLRKSGFSQEDFNIRLVLGCLKTLRKEIPVEGGDRDTQQYRERVLALLRHALPR